MTWESPNAATARPRAFILVAVLILILLISMVAMSLLFRLKAENRASAAGTGAEQAWAAAMSGIEQALRVAAAARPGFTDWRNEPRTFRDQLVSDDGSDRWFFTVYSPPDEEALGELRFGLTDESSKYNVNLPGLTNLTSFPHLTAQQLAALQDFLDPDDSPRPEGAEQEYYSGLPQPYAPRNGPLATFEELLLIRGFTPAVLYGEDANRNWILDPNENDGDERPPADNNDGRLDLGLQPLVTVVSYDVNEDNHRLPRTNLNGDSARLPEAAFPAALTNYLAALRTNQIKLNHPADLLEAKLTIKDTSGRETELASGIGKEELPLVLDLLTATSARRMEGLINLNTASIAILATLPGIDEPLAERILSTRRSISPERRASIAWLYQEGVVDAEQFKRLAPFFTARSYQFSFHVVGFGVPSGQFRVLDVMIDLGSGEPTLSYLRDLTRLGLPFSLQPETAPSQTGIKSPVSPPHLRRKTARSSQSNFRLRHV